MSDLPAPLRLGLAAGGLRQARRHPLLKSTRRPRRAQQQLRLLGSPAAEGWLCLAATEAAVTHRMILHGDAAAAQADGEDAGLLQEDLQALAEGTATVSSMAIERDGHPVQVQFVAATLHRGNQVAGYEELVLSASDAGPPLSLAVALARDLPVQWCGGPPALVAIAALDLIEPAPLRAGQVAFTLPEDAAASDAAIAVMRHCLAQFDANLLPVLRNRDIEGVHQMRVALRRLRSALDVFEPVLPAETIAPLLEELRWLNQPLGRKRDLDVFLHETLLPLSRTPAAAKGLQHLVTVVEDRRVAAQQALESALLSPRCAAWRLAFEAALHALPAQIAASGAPELQARAAQPVERFAATVLQKRRKKVKKLGSQHANLEIEALHRLRIRAKKLRYAGEFFRPVFRRKATRDFLAALAQLQDCLGALNDAAVGEVLMRDVLGPPGDDPAAAAIIGWFSGRQQQQLSHLGEAWDAFAGAKPFWKDALAD